VAAAARSWLAGHTRATAGSQPGLVALVAVALAVHAVFRYLTTSPGRLWRINQLVAGMNQSGATDAFRAIAQLSPYSDVGTRADNGDAGAVDVGGQNDSAGQPPIGGLVGLPSKVHALPGEDYSALTAGPSEDGGIPFWTK